MEVHKGGHRSCPRCWVGGCGPPHTALGGHFCCRGLVCQRPVSTTVPGSSQHRDSGCSRWGGYLGKSVTTHSHLERPAPPGNEEFAEIRQLMATERSSLCLSFFFRWKEVMASSHRLSLRFNHFCMLPPLGVIRASLSVLCSS